MARPKKHQRPARVFIGLLLVILSSILALKRAQIIEQIVVSIHEDLAVQSAIDGGPAAKDDRLSASLPRTSESPTFSSSLPLRTDEVEDYLQAHPDTAGARYIELLRRHLYIESGSESARLHRCRPRFFKPACFDPSLDDATSEKTALLAGTNITVSRLRRFSANNELIPNLGTVGVCLPLSLAGQSVGSNSVAVELGPFAGFSTRCIATGLNVTKKADRLFAFDTFANMRNQKALERSSPWILKGNYTKASKDFQWLWKMAVLDQYPSARSHKVLITKETVEPSVWGMRDVDLLAFDSIKYHRHWQAQLAGLAPMKAGSVIAFNDFQFVPAQQVLLYACLRNDYLLPVFSHWSLGEPWIFVVKNELDLLDVPCDCLKGANASEKLPAMLDKLDEDLLALMGGSAMQEDYNKTITSFSKSMSSDKAWGQLLNKPCPLQKM